MIGVSIRDWLRKDRVAVSERYAQRSLRMSVLDIDMSSARSTPRIVTDYTLPRSARTSTMTRTIPSAPLG